MRMYRKGTKVYLDGEVIRTLDVNMTLPAIVDLITSIYKGSYFVGTENGIHFAMRKSRSKSDNREFTILYSNDGLLNIKEEVKLKDGDFVYLSGIAYEIRKEGDTYALLPI